MYRNCNLGVVIISTATFFLLLFANTCNASAASEGLQRTVYESEVLHHSSLNFSKASHSRYYKNRYYSYPSKRNYYRGSRYYRSGNYYFRGHRYNHNSHRFYKQHNRYYNHKYQYRYR